MDNALLHSEEERFNDFICWALKHNIAFHAFKDELFKSIYGKRISSEEIWAGINQLIDKVQIHIISILNDATEICISIDGWKCARGRFQGIIAHTPGPKGQSYPLAFVPSNTEFMKSEDIKTIVVQTIVIFGIEKD